MDSKYFFDAESETKRCVEWIKEWFSENGPSCSAVIGISGGKDSTIAAALCKEALGADRVIGVAMPDHGQDINDADKICQYLGIKYLKAPIYGITKEFKNMWYEFNDEDFKWSKQSEQNIPPRIRMTMLYAIAQTWNGRVCGTCNLSENYVGYFTKYGDGVSDFEPLAEMTVTEVLQIGDYLGLPEKWVHKVPDDGLPNSQPDEAKFGFSYKNLDDYIRLGSSGDQEIDEKIGKMHKKNLFKLMPVRVFKPLV